MEKLLFYLLREMLESGKTGFAGDLEYQGKKYHVECNITEKK